MWPALVLAGLGLSVGAGAQTTTTPVPAEVRARAQAAGLGSLSNVPVPEVAGLDAIVADRNAAAQLGKALFWDMAIGSDGQACASCHFHAGVDSRVKNQLNPGKGGTDDRFGDSAVTGGTDFLHFGPNSIVKPSDFPFHKLADPGNRRSAVLRDTNDVMSSQGVFPSELEELVFLSGLEVGLPVEEPIFHVNDINVRRVEPRHTPSMINAVFNNTNFWDGRAHNSFNGVSPFGPLDDAARVLVNEGGYLVAKKLSLPNSSLASQAVGPPLSVFEMSFEKRRFEDIARKVLPMRPLSRQLVHPQDSLLGYMSQAKVGTHNKLIGIEGLNTTYQALIKKAFRPEYWASSVPIAIDKQGKRYIPAPYSTPKEDRFNQMEANFSLFFGLAIQLYESTLVSNQTPFDRFMEGDDTALNPLQLQGLDAFVRGGNCSACHAGPELTAASVNGSQAVPFLPIPTVEVGPNGRLVPNFGVTHWEDIGFFAIGVRDTEEDLGRGGTGPNGKPLSFARQALLSNAPLPCGPGSPIPFPCPIENRSTGVDGAFKAPGLRNVELTGPYFHTGGHSTLLQVVDFYRRQSDFADTSIRNISLGMGLINVLEEDRLPLVHFLLSLTDERVRQEKAPFDHPQLFVPNGHPGDFNVLSCFEQTSPTRAQACDTVMEVPGVGALGRPAAMLPPLKPFLNLKQTQY